MDEYDDKADSMLTEAMATSNDGCLHGCQFKILNTKLRQRDPSERELYGLNVNVNATSQAHLFESNKKPMPKKLT